ncbi:MAG: glycosyltransferase family 2 protein [Candidatus Heimdallarchaeaceae archaeon]
MYKDKKISVTIPVYNESKFIQAVIRSVPEFIDYIVVVNDASTDRTQEILENIRDSRLSVIQHEKNEGVGKSTIDGHLEGIKLGADILVRADGDGQIDMKYIKDLIIPLIEEDVDFTKGNRLSSKMYYRDMPFIRYIGNKILTFLTRLSTGYWFLQDSQNGLSAITTKIFCKIPLTNLQKGYLFENSYLVELSKIGAKIKEIDMFAIYGDEKSSINMCKFIPKMIFFQLSCIIKKAFIKKNSSE